MTNIRTFLSYLFAIYQSLHNYITTHNNYPPECPSPQAACKAALPHDGDFLAVNQRRRVKSMQSRRVDPWHWYPNFDAPTKKMEGKLAPLWKGSMAIASPTPM